MEKEHRPYKAHCLVLPYPTQGHLNPMFQFSKVLHRKQIKVTFVTTRFTSKKLPRGSSGIELETISDGYDEGKDEAVSIQAYIERFWQQGPETLAALFERLSSSGCPVDCIVYDSVMSWPLDVAKKFGIVAAAFFTQSCVVDSIYYHVNKGLLQLPLAQSQISLLPGMPPLAPLEFPSFIYDLESYPAYTDLLVGQFSNVEKADWSFCNSIYELEKQVVDQMTDLWPVRTIGPTIPSGYMNKQLEDDKDYGVSLFVSNNDECTKWLDEQKRGSVVYVSFGSGVTLKAEQMEELALGLRRSKTKFLWVVRESEADKLFKGFAEETSEMGMVVSWCSQLKILAHEAVGCFISHCGWNSTLEALSLGVPLVAMPQRGDQFTDAKYIRDVWKVGVKAQADEKGIARREEVEHCISEIMEGEKGKEIRENALKWKDLARKAVNEGGSSDKNIDEFIETLVKR